MCERWVETGTDCYIDSTSSFDHSSSSFASWLGLLNRGSLRDCRLVLTLAFLSQLNSTAAGTLSIFFPYDHLLLLFFGLLTQVCLLIDSSVEGQYITISAFMGSLIPKTSYRRTAVIKLIHWLKLQLTYLLTKPPNYHTQTWNIKSNK